MLAESTRRPSRHPGKEQIVGWYEFFVHYETISLNRYPQPGYSLLSSLVSSKKTRRPQ